MVLRDSRFIIWCEERVVLTDKQILHIADHHPEAYNDVLIELNRTIAEQDYIIRDEKHEHIGLVIREIPSDKETPEHSFIVFTSMFIVNLYLLFGNSLKIV